MIWIGVDTKDMGDLDAEIEVCLGQGMERIMVTTSTAIFVPKGTPHYPATIHKMNKKSLYMEISYTKRYSEKVYAANKNPEIMRHLCQRHLKCWKDLHSDEKGHGHMALQTGMTQEANWHL